MSMNFGSTPPPAEYSEPPVLVAAEARLRALRLLGAFLGILLVVAGAGMAVMLFQQILRAVVEPEAFKSKLDKWETVVRGNVPMAEQYIEKDKPDVASDDEAPKNRQVSLAKSVAEVLVVVARPSAAVFLLLVVALLVSLATAIIDAGGRLIALAVNEQALMRKMLREVGGKK
jgi:hypothetical protein